MICSSLNRLLFMFCSFLRRTPVLSRLPFCGQANAALVISDELVKCHRQKRRRKVILGAIDQFHLTSALSL